MREYLLVLFVAAGATYLLSGLARTIAVRTGALATVRNRDVHTHPIPYFGGMAMFGGLVIAMLLAVQMPFLGRYTTVEHDASAVLWAGLVICIVGVLDDKYDMPALVKLGGQVLAAGVAVMQGVRIYWIPLPDRIVGLDDTTSIMVTVLIIAICVNAVNFVDGLDGLAAGVVAIGSGAFFSYTYVLAYEQELARATTASLITVATCGIAVGFLFHNWHPAKMFMGDSGAMLLGLLMAMSAISFTGQLDPSALAQGSDVLPAILPILLPVAALALPLLDLMLAWVRRAWNGQHPFQADKQHLHHRLLARGHSHWGAVLLMYGWSAVVSVGLVLIALTNRSTAVWLVAGSLVTVLVLTLWPVRTAPSFIGGREAEVVDTKSVDD
ncbi:undecaprenyl/decaprenyl-phosphate alpha-N-acetylglucosaminyl 1-phosphate transferase [Tessaracoccus sp. MC1865]|uniref:MraY family glycosyltransferase n=1 Tax=Tessaracoccus sp. MC1865 TaxID=2760310 RepID=UPI0016016BBF|nr:MraY family glycosyltransferase [Tessaracoccus sp. MC1865]MBB1483459.1 undecaprenyl/decaprenyl-phosphate alpha-N-acetylglucosaminyl 1-phosphate transferase [Tessaracoccus sp. MC1865]QTO36558.1 undecaprenyl/decaprenyl-phosphate alpha-N-acetylglucosaminyl 1-phosphate transferase [Tessaracoccus sp. MC1865]